MDKHLIATATAGNVFVKSDGTTTPTIDYGTAPDRGTLCTITVVKSALPDVYKRQVPDGWATLLAAGRAAFGDEASWPGLLATADAEVALTSFAPAVSDAAHELSLIHI